MPTRSKTSQRCSIIIKYFGKIVFVPQFSQNIYFLYIPKIAYSDNGPFLSTTEVLDRYALSYCPAGPKVA